jgi:hypothetical protein
MRDHSADAGPPPRPSPFLGEGVHPMRLTPLPPRLLFCACGYVGGKTPLRPRGAVALPRKGGAEEGNVGPPTPDPPPFKGREI